MKGCIMDTLSTTLVDKLDMLLKSYSRFQMNNRGYQLYKVVNAGNNLYHVLSFTKLGKSIGMKLRFIHVYEIIEFIEKDIARRSQ